MDERPYKNLELLRIAEYPPVPQRRQQLHIYYLLLKCLSADAKALADKLENISQEEIETVNIYKC